MADLRPNLNAMTAVFGIEAFITLPGRPAVIAHWHEQKPATEPFPNDAGTYSLTKSQRRGSLRLGELPAAPRPDVSWPPPGTMIELPTRVTPWGASVDAELLTVTGVDYQDVEIAHVIATAYEGD